MNVLRGFAPHRPTLSARVAAEPDAGPYVDEPLHQASDHHRAVCDAWEFTARISPRRLVRAATVGADGEPVNCYPLVHPVTGVRPLTPWAVPLTGKDGRFRLLCLDLDAKPSPEAAARDAALLADLLTELAIPCLVCESGPTGGRHVWVGPVEAVDAELVAVLARLVKAWLPTLDLAPLTNPASGCVRPPGAPHRLGGTSRVLAGSLDVLLEPCVTAAQLRGLVGRLAERVTITERPQPGVRRESVDDDGTPHLAGQRRPLSAPARALLDAVPSGDHSAVLWRILCSAAVAHWRYHDVQAAADAPGLEHARTLRCGNSRTPRPSTGSASPTAVLRRQWTRAVHAMATAPTRVGPVGDDATFDGRAETVNAIVRTAQARADATPGRWADRTGLVQRRVLDALCLFHLQAVHPDSVEADIRRLALTCGSNRETVRRALHALATEGWIEPTHRSFGPHGACWSIDPTGTIHKQTMAALSQADPRPSGAGAAQRTLLVNELTERLTASAHDSFTPRGGLGTETGSLYGRLTQSLDMITCSRLMGWTPDQTLAVLHKLAAAGLVVGGHGSWQRTEPKALDEVAAEQGTTGLTRTRAARYAAERAAWARWQTELNRMHAHHPYAQPRHTPAASPQPPPALLGAHPRGTPTPDARRQSRLRRSPTQARSEPGNLALPPDGTCRRRKWKQHRDAQQTSQSRLLLSLTLDRALAEARFRCLGWSLSFAAVHSSKVGCDSHLACAAPDTDPGRERLKKGMLCH